MQKKKSKTKKNKKKNTHPRDTQGRKKNGCWEYTSLLVSVRVAKVRMDTKGAKKVPGNTINKDGAVINIGKHQKA